MKPHLPKLLLAGAAAAALTSVASAQSVPVYLETFNNTAASGNATYTSVGWSWYWNTTTATAVNRSGQTSGTAINRETTLGSATQNIGQSGGGSMGAAFFGGSNVTAHFGFTTEYNGTTPPGAMPLSTSSIREISFLQGNTGAFEFHVAIQVGDSWYVTTVSQSGTAGYTNGAAFAADPVKLTFSNLHTASWSALAFSTTAPQALSIGSAATLPVDSAITGFGIYAVPGASGNTGRIDDFTVSVAAIPEPSAFAALAGLAGLGMAASRRRRR